MLVPKQRGNEKALVDSTPPRRNMKSIDLLFTLDSFKHKACNVSVANTPSQYTLVFSTSLWTCKTKEKKFPSCQT